MELSNKFKPAGTPSKEKPRGETGPTNDRAERGSKDTELSTLGKGSASVASINPAVGLLTDLLTDLKNPAPLQQLDLSRVFIPDWGNKPPEVPPILLLNDTGFLTHQNAAGLIAHPGLGKSKHCESILSSYVASLASSMPAVRDCLGWSVHPSCRGVILIDFERTQTDVWNSFYWIARRAGLEQGASLGDARIFGLRAIPRPADRRAIIEYLLSSYPCSLLVLDGYGDLVNDINDLEEAIDMRCWVREITAKYELSVFGTLHPNPMNNKPRGHLGSEIARECETVLLLKKGEGDQRIITSDFEHGKTRNGPAITAGYQWNDEAKMFLSLDPSEIMTGRGQGSTGAKMKAENAALRHLPAGASLGRGELERGIMAAEGCSESSANRRVTDMIKYQFVIKDSNGKYHAL